jgi:hypothetical protein
MCFVVILIGFGHSLACLHRSKKITGQKFAALPIPVIVAACSASSLFSVAYQVMSADMHPFIYFQF